MTRFNDLVATVKQYTKDGHNVMLVGKHGVGKTAIITRACEELGLRTKYWSAPLIDPDIDLGGIPVPNKKTGTLDFFSNKEIWDAEVIFLDELNRAAPRTLNMIFELLQFKSVHGKKLPNLKCVHCAINPPGAGSYDVQQLDDALMDRFYAFIEVRHEFPHEIVRRYVRQDHAAAMAAWYDKLDSSSFVSPRRMEYAAQLYAKGYDIKECFTDSKLPVGALVVALAGVTLQHAQVEQVVVKEIEPWEEAEYVAVRDNPDLKLLHEAFTQYVAESGVTEEQVWERVKQNREKAKAQG